MQRNPHQIVLYIELEDNVGQILGKRKLEVPFSPESEFIKLNEEEIPQHFIYLVNRVAEFLKSY